MANLSAEILAQYKIVAETAAKKAGEVIRNAFYKQKVVEHKGAVDLVTETDKNCEALILKEIKKSFPSHKFIGEEEASVGGTAELTDDPTWMVDPLDGTTNFVHKQFLVAVKGNGAFLNGEKIQVSEQLSLGNALVATEVGTARDKATVDRTTERINRLLFKVRSLRLSGSCAMNMVGVAIGRLDAFFEIGFGGCWDVAAAAVIVEEAGGHVFDPSGKPFNVMSRRVAVTNGHLKDQFVEALAELD